MVHDVAHAGLGGDHVRRVRPLEQERHLAEDRPRLADARDGHAVPDDGELAALEDEQLAGRRAGPQQRFAEGRFEGGQARQTVGPALAASGCFLALLGVGVAGPRPPTSL